MRAAQAEITDHVATGRSQLARNSAFPNDLRAEPELTNDASHTT